ncbi:hypothetical protein CSOJ01_15899 [Colletotrichum sojae]|uniref:Protein kinase domain-containing protein n=1 Tax=Colletotrichum sojae TaxID=2175907 RepID=A0A8H6MG31_9PEZI|nr:hypothetical protein CSOJ01_15899 [Colletotrichum sojae]
MEGVEPLEYYGPGGYHPVHIGDRLDGRYRVVHKLRDDLSSITWLALDEKLSKYVGVKVGIGCVDRIEGDVLSRLAKSASDDASSENKPTLFSVLLDRFDISGPNGIHPCLVTSPTRHSLGDLKGETFEMELFQLDVTRSLAAQLSIAVAQVHSSGYAHGDIGLHNAFFQFPPSLNYLSVNQVYKQYGEARAKAFINTDTQMQSGDHWAPSYRVFPMEMDMDGQDIALHEAKLTLTGFGAAFRPADKPRFPSHKQYWNSIRPPEAYFEPGSPLTFAWDIWSLGNAIFELLARRPLLNVWDAIAQQVHMSGPMPPEWWEKWGERSKWFDGTGRPLNKELSQSYTWEALLEDHVQSERRSDRVEPIGEGEKDALLRLLWWMLAWRPAERPSAPEVLETE